MVGKLKVINLLGAPGAGKTTAALQLVSDLMKKGYLAEYIPEYAKTCVWYERHKEMEDQLHISGEQHHRQFMLQGKLDVVVTDSPILLCTVYMPEWMHLSRAGELFTDLMLHIEDRYDNKYFFVNRAYPFEPRGRLQTEEQSEEVRRDLLDKLELWDRPYVQIDGDLAGPAKIYENLIKEKWLPERDAPLHI